MKKTNQIMRRALAWSCMATTTLLVPLAASAQSLVHEYSFNGPGPTNVVDSVGGPAWDGIILTGGTNAAPGPGGSTFLSGQLYLAQATEDYVQLPPGILSNYTAVTIDTWVTLQTLPNNCFLWGFGDTETDTNSPIYGQGHNYIFCQPLNGRIAITDTNYSGEQNCGPVGSFEYATPAEIHVTAVFDPPAGYEALYTNGVLAAENNAVTDQLDQISNVINYLGRSLYLGDGYYDSAWDEFRIWDGALNPVQVAACDVNGPDNTNDTATITGLQLSFPYYQLVQGSHETATANVQIVGFSHSVDVTQFATFSSLDPTVCTTTNNVIYAVGQGNASIVATYDGISSTQVVSVVPPVSVLVHDYSFSDANGSTTVADSVGGAAWDGTVMSNGTNAVPTGGAFTNGVLWLNAATSNYVQLPSGILSNYSAVTIEGWVTAQTAMTAAYHSMYYAFGTTHSDNLGYNYIFGSLPRVYTAITSGTYSSEQGTTEQDYTLTTNVLIHWAAIYNPTAGYIALYTNGMLQSVNRAVTDPLSVVSPLEAFIGRSLYVTDPYASIALDEFRIYNGALTPQGIAISDDAGPNSVPAGVTNGPGTLLSLTLQAPSTIEAPATVHVQLLANYTSLTNWDIIGNSIFPPTGLTITSSDTNVLYLDSNNVLHSKYPGVATVTVVYEGTTNTATITVTEPSATPTLVHRYSFGDANGSTTVADSVGGSTWDGTVMAGGTNGVPTAGNFTNGVLYISSAVSNYVELPGGILSNYTAVTIETWANMTSFPNDSYLWSFGDTDPAVLSGGQASGYDLIFCAPYAGNLTISDADPSWQGGVGVNDQNWNGRTDFHLTAVFDPPAHYMAIYTNGVLAAINNNETIPMSSVSNVFSYIGRSLYYADPFASFSIDEFRMYDGVMTPADVAATQLLGPSQVLTTNAVLSAAPSAGNVTLTWPLAASGFTLQSRASLTTGTWTTVTPAAAPVGNHWQVTVPKTSGTQFFRLVR